MPIRNFVTPAAALALVLGANLGSAINPLFEGGTRGDPASWRLPVGNLLNRLVGVADRAAVPAVRSRANWRALQPDAAKMTAEFHMLFNVALAAIFIGAARRRGVAAGAAVAGAQAAGRSFACRAISTKRRSKRPPLALANAARETLRMGDIVEAMLRQVMAALMTNDRKLAGEVSRMDNVVDRLNEAIKLYITKLTRGSLDEREGRRAMEIVSFTINLEHIGDIIDKNLCELAGKKIKRRYQFSAEGAAELTAFHKRVVESLQIAFGVFMTGDVDGGAQAARAKRPSCAKPSSTRPTGISSACAKAGRKAWKPPRCISTF